MHGKEHSQLSICEAMRARGALLQVHENLWQKRLKGKHFTEHEPTCVQGLEDLCDVQAVEV